MSAESSGPPGDDRAVSLPADHSFVIQLRRGSGTGPDGPWTGRVEHVVTGRSAPFSDCGALFDFIVQTLRHNNADKSDDH